MRAKCRQLLSHEEGASIIEFALVAPIFFFLIFLITELGLLVFTQIALESATMQVSRSASIGGSSGGCDRACTIKALVQQKTLGLINSQNVVVEMNTLAAGGVSTAAQPEYCLTAGQVVTPNADGTCPGGGVCINDANNNGKCDSAAAMSVGNAGDLVEIRVSYPWKMMIPFLDSVTFGQQGRSGTLYGANGVVTLSSSTVIKNEPF